MNSNQLFTFLVIGAISLGSAQNLPFPQNKTFANFLKPNHKTSTVLASEVKLAYGDWKSKYVKKSNGTTPGGGFYVNMKGVGGNGTEITTSEAHGYGMITFALMAGADDSAKIYLDGMVNMYDKHRSVSNNLNMSWVISTSESQADNSSGATDGDMDIAYALLLANDQWGSGGSWNYKKMADSLIQFGIKGSSVSLTTKRTLAGDWASDQFGTRSSDWMADHFKAFATATKDVFWTQARDTAYSLATQIQKNYSPKTGLLPDFMAGEIIAPDSKGAGTGEPNADQFSWNGCRFPWRFATDFAHYGSPQSKAILSPFLSWAKTKTANIPTKFQSGYKLDGTVLSTGTSAAFISPLITALATDPTSQTLVNNGWDWMAKWRVNYYDDSINLLNLLLLSGNWWAPGSNQTATLQLNKKQLISVANNHNFIKTELTEIGTWTLSNVLGQNIESGAGSLGQINWSKPLRNGIYVLDIQGNVHSVISFQVF